MTAVASAVMATGDPYLFNNFEINSQTFVSNEVPNYPEMVEAPEFGEHDSCEECPLALSCMGGALEHLAVAKTREEQREGKSLPCMDEGRVRLKVLTDEEASAIYNPFVTVPDVSPWDPNAGTITIEPAPADGTSITSGTITVGTTVPDPNDLLDYTYNPSSSGSFDLDMDFGTTTIVLDGKDP